MESAAKSLETSTKTQDARSHARAPTHQVAANVPEAAFGFAAIQQIAGNLAIQRLFDSDLPQTQFTSAQPELVAREGTTLPEGNITTGAQPWNQSSVVTKQAAEAAKPSGPQAKKGNEITPALDETRLKETAPGEAPPGKEIPQETAAPEQAPASAEEDPQYQVVVEQMEIKAKGQKTPAKKPEQKQGETVLAAKAATKDLTNNRYRKENHLRKIGQVQRDDLTMPQFMAEFGVAVQKLAANVPTNNSDEQRAVFESAQKTATQDLATQGKKHSQPLRDEADKDPSTYSDNKKEEATDYKLEPDPPGNVPVIKQARAAAPKPEPDKVISLDDKSRELDEALRNHDVAGQKINIDESSLAFPVSGEKSFDEAGEAKREAQAEIAKAKPRYREQETGVIGKSQNDIDSLVNVQGLLGHHGLRSEGFKKVLGHQERHKTGISSVKQTFFDRVEGIYKGAKEKVDEALNSLTEGYTIEEELEWILADADKWFKWWTRANLEYIYPGFFERSDFTDDYKDRILAEYKQLVGEKYRDLDEALERLSTKHKTLGDIAKSIRGIGGADLGLYLKALSTVQHQVSLEFFEKAKAHFIYLVTTDVEKKIARRVVNAVNRARGAIVKGNDDVDAAYNELKPKEQEEVDDVYNAVKDRFKELRKTVDERQHEIVADMARTYNKSVGKLKATFEAIKEDVRMGILERAWNKIKAVINAIIDFATRLAELLGKMIGLLGDIISSPRAFFRNLAAGISEGFSEFGRRIDEFLATAFFDWIRGASGVMVQFPKEWNAAGIFSLFTQLLNLSTETIWQRMEVVYDKTVANAFRRGEVLLDKGLELFDIVKREGLGGLWDHIVESLGTLLSDTLDEMKETVLYAAIKKVFIEIGKMLIPGGGFIAIAEKVIRLLVFIVEARNKILDLIEAFVLSMENAVNGDIAGIVKRVTGALTKFITVALDFLVAFFGLSDLKGKVERFIERMRSPIIRGIDFVLKKFKPLVMKAKEVVAKGTEKVVGAGKKVVAKVANWLGIRKRFTSEGETHTLFFRGSETSAELWVATDEMPFTSLLSSKQIEINEITVAATKARKQTALTNASNIYNNDIVRLKSALATAGDEASKNQLQSDLNDKFNDIVPHLVVIGVGSGGKLPKTEVKVGAPRGRADWVEADPVTKYESKKPDRVTVEPLGWASHIKTIANFDDIYVRLHLLHFDLGGPGNDTGNVTPGRKSENINMYNQTEQHAVDLVHGKSKVLWYRANVTGYRSEQGYTDFAEGIRVRYGFKERKEDGEWVKVGDVLYDNVFPVTKPDPKGTNDPVPTINTLTFDYWDDELKKIPNRPTRDTYRDLIKAKNKTGGYADWAAFIGSKEFQVANVEYGGNLEDWFKGAIALGKIRSI